MKLQRRKAYNAKVEWSTKDEKTLLNFIRKNEFNAEELLQLFPNRTLPSIRSKVRKLRIAHDLFGHTYRGVKEQFTQLISESVKPKIVFEAYAGAGHQTFIWAEIAEKVFAAEIMKSKIDQFRKEAEAHGFHQAKKKFNWFLFKKGKKEIYYYSGDTIGAAADLRANNIKVDLIDLDTCGSTLPTLPYFLVMLQPKHLVITHGEFHSMRFKREDVLRRLFVHRDINKSPLPITVEKMANELDTCVKVSALRSHNETTDSFWPKLKNETWLGGKFHGMLRRHYAISRPAATADSLNYLSSL